MKGKVSRDLQQNQRENDDKIKVLRNMLTEMLNQEVSKNEVYFEQIKDRQAQQDAKLAQVETKEVLIDYMNTEIRRTKMEFEDKIAS